MSVQLIVYPQNYEGTPNPISANNTEFMVDAINFNNVSTSTIYTPSFPYEQNTINFFAPNLSVNQWDRYIQSGETAPTGAGGQMFFSGSSGGAKGVIQKLSNLTIGDIYNVTFDISSVSGSSSVLTLSTYTGTILNASVVVPQTVGIVSVQFTANSSSEIIAVGYVGIDTIVFNSISVINAAATPSGNIFHLGDGQVILDLYEDEDIPLSLSVDDFKNVAEKVQSYSKAFNIPETKRNKRIFDNIFEITRHLDAGSPLFNPYKKTQCVLKQDGFILFEGYLRLLDVTDKEGEVSYNVNLYSEVVALADVLGDLTFSDLDFTELEHDYNKTQITSSWNDTGSGITYLNPNNSGFRDANSTVKYPFVNWNNNWLIANGSTGTSATLNNPELTSLEQAFRPFINVRYLIDRIFDNVPFTYESAFFDTDDFKKLYMDFNWGADNIPFTIADSGLGKPLVGQTATASFATIESADNNYGTNIGYSSGVYTALLDNQTYNMNWGYFYTTGVAVAWSAEFRWKMVKGGVTSYLNVTPISGTGVAFGSSNGNFTQILNTGDTLTPEFKSDTASTNTFTLHGMDSSIATSSTIVATSASAATNNTFLQTLRGETGQWDFLKGLMTMFNLVTLPDEDNPNNIIIEPYSDVFINSADSVQLNWTDKIDVSEMKLEPLTDLNKKTIFKFVEDDDDFAFTNYKNQVGGHLYGSKKFDASNEFNILDGEDEVVAEPFAATVVKPLVSQFSAFITPALYSYNSDDETSEGFDNSPRIMYNNGIKSTGASYYIPAQNGGTSANETDYLKFSHLKDAGLSISAGLDFHFGECQLLVGASTPNNLFNLYWLPYFKELYNINTRTMTIKVNLTPADINTFKFNDTVFIKNRVFRVNKIDYKPNDLATVEFILIP